MQFRKMTVSKLLLSSPNLPKPLLAFVEEGREDSCSLMAWADLLETKPL